jgi:SAM-dependent methyltransferase
MGKDIINLSFGRQAFGADPAGYHAVRPDYPEWVFKTLKDHCGAGQDTTAFEIGAGTGKATRHILDLNVRRLTAIEPDRRMADYLQRTTPDRSLEVIASTFEEVELADAGFDLGFSATSLHWLDEDQALQKVARLLRPGGWWAMVWNVTGDPDRADPFHEATKALLEGPSSPSREGEGQTPFGLDKKARLAALQRTRAFDDMEHQRQAWSITLDPDQVMALYGTYSNINIRSDRAAVLAELGRIAREEFNGHVTRNLITSLYIARRK